MLKKLISKKGAAFIAAILLTLGVCDLTLTEQSHLQPVINSISEGVSGLLGGEKEAETAPLIQGSDDKAE